MTSISRRVFLQTVGGAAWASAAFGSYAIALEPGFRLEVTPYHVFPRGWTPGLRVRAAVLSDIHACEPWMSPSRIRAICEVANALQPDVVFLLGDYSGGHTFMTQPVTPEQWSEPLSILRAPLGVYAVLGNHDWMHGPLPGMPSDDAEGVKRGLALAGARLLENDAARLVKDGAPFWVVGVGDQIAGPRGLPPTADIPKALARVGDDAPALLLAHEPHAFRLAPARVSLTLAGHTHGGQINIPYVQNRFARVFDDLVYGHIVEGGRDLIISAGLGTTHAPVRFMRPPEIVDLTIDGAAPLAATI
ncbi:metallophosphoesterase [Methylocella sp.]|uniref:metallophosphoesterase n=1 Tax=Methylocella sp. TaxID=1978226 RepID=UPI0035AE2181